MELKRVNLDDNSFTANGVKYLINGEPLTLTRMAKLEELLLRVQFGYDVKEFPNALKSIIDLFNTSKDVEAKHKLYNLYQSSAEAAVGMPNPSLLICTLFILKEGENRAEWVEAEQIEKIKDWEFEGIPFADFFALAVHLLPQFTTH